jgi:hypothetical protein
MVSHLISISRIQVTRAGFESRQGQGFSFLSSTTSRPALGPTQPPIPWAPRDLSPGIKQPGSEADHSPPSSAEVKNAWSYILTPQYVFIFMFYKQAYFVHKHHAIKKYRKAEVKPHAFLTSRSDADEWSALRSDRPNPMEVAPAIYRLGDWVGHRLIN